MLITITFGTTFDLFKQIKIDRICFIQQNPSFNQGAEFKHKNNDYSERIIKESFDIAITKQNFNKDNLIRTSTI